MGRGMGVEGSMNFAVKLTAAEGEFGAEEWTNFALLQKLKEFLAVLEHFGKMLMAKVEEVSPFVQQKLKEFLGVLEHLGKMFMGKVDEVFPPGTRVEQLKHCAQIAAPYIIVAAAFWILFRCCCRCGRVGSAGKTMVAPGTGRAFRIPRASFEASPRSYFRGLRGK